MNPVDVYLKTPLIPNHGLAIGAPSRELFASPQHLTSEALKYERRRSDTISKADHDDSSPAFWFTRKAGSAWRKEALPRKGLESEEGRAEGKRCAGYHLPFQHGEEAVVGDDSIIYVPLRVAQGMGKHEPSH